jgi:hypothetical protein
MIDYELIRVDPDWGRVFVSNTVVDRSLIDWVNDVARAVERTAQDLAPLGETGQLKGEGITRTEASHHQTFGDLGAPGSVVTDLPAFGGGFTVRGGNPRNRGQFSSVSRFRDPGYIFTGGVTRGSVTATVELNPAVPHGKWVHEGTGIYGPHRTPIVPVRKPHLVFHIGSRKFILKSVKGQKAQPFLTEAYAYVNTVYVPAKLAELRGEISAST